VRKVDEDKPLSESVAEAVKEVGWPITSGTLTTLFAFLPLLLLQSDTGDFMRALPASVSLVLLASLFTALLIIPALLINWKIKPIERVNLQSLMEKTSEKVYRPILAQSIRWPIFSVVIGLAIAAFFISFFPKVGVSLFPKAEKNIIVVNVENPVNSSIEHTKQTAFKLAEELETLPHVEYVIENIGGSNPRIYYNQLNRMGESHFSQLMLFLDSYDGTKIEELIQQIRTEYANYAGGKVSVYEFQQGPVTDRPITVRLVGDDLAALSSKADDLYEYLANLEGTNDVQNMSNQVAPEVSIKLDEYKLMQAGFTLEQIEAQLTTLVNGSSAAMFYDKFGENYRVVVQPSASDISSLFNQTQFINNKGQLVPLNQFAELSMEAGSAPFYHYQKQRMMKVSADYLPGYNVQVLTQKMQQFLDSQDWQDGVYYIVGGEEAARQESFGGLSQIMLIAFGGIFTILVIQFKSFIQPIIIFSIMPISITGAIFGLYLTGNSFSMLAFIGMISLLGIVVNDSIIMVDSFNRHRQRGEEKKLAMLEAATKRFTPIIFTSLTTILGLLPLTLYGGLLWEPMGWVIITGLMFSTLTCLFFVPSVALLLSFRK
jgi:multidrug efflux pump subunit AcrB